MKLSLDQIDALVFDFDGVLTDNNVFLDEDGREWTVKNGEKIPYFIQVPSIETIFFAAIWKFSYIKKQSTKTFSIITKPANNLLKEIHDRMPVTLSAEESKDYLDHNNSDYLKNNVKSIFEEYFEFFKISKFVNNPINNSSECIKPIK